jgi:hypothetical protein
MRRRSKRKAAVLAACTLDHGGQLRRSKRKLVQKEEEHRIYGDDFGILPSD